LITEPERLSGLLRLDREKRSGGEKKPIDLAADRRVADVRDKRKSPR
jgi:hypothetical protein